MNKRHIYVVFSSTPYRISRMIRQVTREYYNHASIALDENLTQMYSFARRYCNTPLYGGFVKESASRFQHKGVNSNIRICRVDVTQEQYEQLKKHLEQMYQNRHHYLYNHLSAAAATVHKSLKLRDAFTCVEFCVEVLHMVGVNVDPTKYYSVEDLMRVLDSNTIYIGQMYQNGPYDDIFYAKRPVRYPVLTTAKSILALAPRFRTK